DNPYLNVLSLIDVTYPPLICSTCDRVATSANENRNHHIIAHHQRTHRGSLLGRAAAAGGGGGRCGRRYPCLHPHCDRSFDSRTALRFHLSRSHLVRQASLKHLRPEPPFMRYPLQPPLGSFTSSFKPSILFHNNLHHHHHHQHQHHNHRQSNSYLDQQQQHTCTPTPTSTSSTSTTTTTPRQTLSRTSEALINSVYHPLYCPCCHEHFPKKTNVIKHVAEVHHDQEPYSCVYSDCTAHRKHYATRDGLVYHTLRVHD
ncbi:hypothetical protein BDB00DRAFT_747947, partial [Zychaea mexicana]|uniref:uncharacterized protein n=1 Tax=Zychaea mexicana TaxID=64656 RepID=UPI0022FDDCE1